MAVWMDAGTWVAQVERAQEQAAARVPDYQRGEVPELAPRSPGGRRQRMSDGQFRAAADRAREVGVRPVARELGVSHVALLRAWRRRGIVVRRA